MKDKICILMSTWNGELYIRELLESLYNQKDVQFDILVRDDGSKDSTLDILEEYKNKYKNFSWYKGEGLGPAWSFMDLMKNAGEYKYYAFCDQDDVWDEDKLLCAYNMLEKEDSSIPLLYFCATRQVDKDLNVITPQLEIFDYALTFNEALVSSIGMGCTFVFNKKTLDMAVEYNPDNGYLVMHDKLLHYLVAATGKIIYDKTPHIAYRQHGNNVVGAKNGIVKKMKTFLKILFAKGKSKYTRQAENLYQYKKYFSAEINETLDQFVSYRKSFKSKMKLIKDKTIKTQSGFFNMGLNFLIFIGKL